jgi:DUF1009 family protein
VTEGLVIEGVPCTEALGLIAGRGELTLAIADSARAMGYRVVAVALDTLADESLKDHVDEIDWFNVGKVGAIIRHLRKRGVKKAVLAGKVPKGMLYTGGIRPDLKAAGMLLRLRDRKDDSIILAVEHEFAREGIEFLDMKEFCADILTPEGKLTRKGPTRAERKDIEFGFRMAKGIGALDIGQTVVVKDRAVMAVEAIEGTDEAIVRGGGLAGPGAVVVKVSRPGQDMRFDVPVVGPRTLDSMIEAGARVLAVEAGKSIFVNKDTFVKRAEKAGISVVGVSGDS